VYRERAFPLKEAPQKYRKLLWDARQDGTCAYFPNMRKFMNNQDTARKLWLVNYELRYAQPELTGGASEAETRYAVSGHDTVSPADGAEVRYSGTVNASDAVDVSGT
jgi:hypothetical protein